MTRMRTIVHKDELGNIVIPGLLLTPFKKDKDFLITIDNGKIELEPYKQMESDENIYGDVESKRAREELTKEAQDLDMGY